MLLLAVLPAGAASEAEFRKLSKTYTLRADGSQEMRVQKELTLFSSDTRQCLRRGVACRSCQRTGLQPVERNGRGAHRT